MKPNVALGDPPEKLQTVEETFEIDECELREKAMESDYWQRCYEFYEDVKRRETESLKPAQIDWLDRIENDLG